MSKRILCKFFTHGACLKGEQCEFSHDWKDESSNICTYYKKGSCSFGSRCRYDHVKAPRSKASSNFLPGNSASASLQSAAVAPLSSSNNSPSWASSSHLSASSRPFVPQAADDNVTRQNYPAVQLSDIPICSFAAAGNCPRQELCLHIHGDLCTICEKHCLHPFRPAEREEHVKSCLMNKKHLEALRNSQDIECCVCLDPVLSKPKPSERKFGILSECDHSFCISCIRNWRNNSLDAGMDANSTLRTCPICRKLSYFVIPSVIWYSSKEEKMDIVDTYKAKLRSIDCRHFNFGNGSCSFGTSCFYKHAYRDGHLEEVVLRHLNSEDGNTVISKDVRLSDFFSGMRL